MIELMFLQKVTSIKQVIKRVSYLLLLIFLDKGFKFQLHVYNGCHDVLMMSDNLNDIAILKINNADYCCIINRISQSDAVNLC